MDHQYDSLAYLSGTMSRDSACTYTEVKEVQSLNHRGESKFSFVWRPFCQFLEGSTAERLWDRAVNTHYPNAVQRTNGALNVIYKDLIDLIAVQENCGNKIRQYVSHLRFAGCCCLIAWC